MFYLKQFFKVLLKNPVEGIVFSLMSIALVASVIHKDAINKKISKELSLKEGSYFHALISAKENTARIARKLRAIPYVSKVELMTKKEISSQVKKTLSTIKFDLSSSNINLNYEGLRLEYKAGIDLRSKKLIRNYLKRFVGPSKIIIGDIKNHKKPFWKRSVILNAMVSYGEALLIVILFIIWLPICFLFKKKLDHYSYLLGFYQRRERISLKIAISGVFLFFTVTCIVSIPFNLNLQNFNLALIGTLLLMLITQLKQFQNE